MSPDNIIELTQKVKDAISASGINWIDFIHGEVPPNVTWKAPPLILEGSLYEMNKRDLLQVSISLSYEEFHQQYELYIYALANGIKPSTKELCLSFGIPLNQLPRLFPRAEADDEFNYVPALASLAYYNFNGELEIDEFFNFVVACGRYKYGVRKLAAVTNESDFTYPRSSFVAAHPNFDRRRYLEDTELSNRFSILLENLKSRLSPEALEDMRFAMTLLIINETALTRDLWGFSKWIGLSHPDTVDDMLNMAGDFRTYQQPLDYIRGVLVPEVLNATQFKSFFRGARNSSPSRLTELDMILGEVKQFIKNEREKKCY
ncbi:hypothetical protein [Methylotenera sp.]|uniref:hypothetical protein n=1 Tax=Methylotenera sp. TaxID=2051956 RepID=UPI002487B2CF|nr:hypothetical protein [Methylotenera sp.]MDI1360633.1 hypothetical protein [Methylotenera sp.]